MALARNTDPHTSHEAAFEHEISGRACTNRELVCALVELHPGHTSRELVEHVALTHRQFLDRYEIARRLADLERLGKVRKGAARECGAGGRAAVTWYPV